MHRKICDLLRTGPPTPRGEQGSASVFVIALVVVLMALAGLVADGGRAVNARVAAADDAEQAARAGANQLDAASLDGAGVVRLDPGAAHDAATAFLVTRGYDVSRMVVSADGSRVNVSVSREIPTVLLRLAFINSFTVEGTATARAATGITAEITGAP